MISSALQPICCLCIISDSAKTAHRPAILTGLVDFRDKEPKSSIAIPSLEACLSRKEPVPAAHTVFMAKSDTTPFLSSIILLSWPPICNIVEASGIKFRTAVPWAVISFLTISADSRALAKSRPLPVVPHPFILKPGPISWDKFSRPSFKTPMGLPWVLRYSFSISLYLLSIRTRLMLTEPASTPRYKSLPVILPCLSFVLIGQQRPLALSYIPLPQLAHLQKESLLVSVDLCL